MKAQLIILMLGLLSAKAASAQVTIGANSVVNASGTLSTGANVTNKSSVANLSTAHLTLSGTQQTIATDQPINLFEMNIIEGGTKTLSGNWNVTNTLQLINGVLHVNDNARLFYSGETASEGSELSFVEGFFFQQGAGRKYFPLGVNGVYAPIILEDAPSNAGEIGIRVVGGEPQFRLPDQVSLSVAHYWEMNKGIASPVSLSLTGVRNLTNETELTVLESDALTGTASAMEGSRSNSFITSTGSVHQPFLAIGTRGEFQIIIHDMITPFIRDDMNDNLFIENIGRTKSNKVRLFDRWGALIETWTDYSNDTAYDFSRLSPGNYACVVDFVLPGDTQTHKAKGMVTIIKAK